MQTQAVSHSLVHAGTEGYVAFIEWNERCTAHQTELFVSSQWLQGVGNAICGT